jgi:hypothetical protein
MIILNRHFCMDHSSILFMQEWGDVLWSIVIKVLRLQLR